MRKRDSLDTCSIVVGKQHSSYTMFTIKSTPTSTRQTSRQSAMASNHRLSLLVILVSLMILCSTLYPQQTESYHLRRKHVRALKKVAIAASVLGNRKKVMIPLPLPLPVPIPIIHKHEPIISPIDPLLTLALAKGSKGQGYGGLHGGLGGFGYGRR